MQLKIAVVFTISSTFAPLDRSLTGFENPCKIGPSASAFARY